ncbi:MAG: GDP-mannose 4,6-dehydratase [Bdellovibrionales bacterium]|nr:GDP-mannose 4,6-dehydratase [Bdellovibrionales bacterium]
MKKALITGVTGQDGSYLAEFLLLKGYEVHGLVRRASTFNRERIDHLFDLAKHHEKTNNTSSFTLHYGDLGDSASLTRILLQVQPDEVYNLAAQSHVKISFDLPVYTADVTGLGTLRLLEAVRDLGTTPKIYLAGSSEMFGMVREIPQKETTPFYPRSPYGAAKVFNYWMGVNYRESYDMFISNGILFNHESPRRGENFVTRKITLGVAAIKLGLQKQLKLGNLKAKRDWGYAKDYVEGMWMMLQHDQPDDFVLATGETHTVEEFCKVSFEHAGMDWQDYVVTDPKYFRPAEVDLLIGDATKAKEKLGWEHKTSFKELAALMVEHDINYLKNRYHL